MIAHVPEPETSLGIRTIPDTMSNRSADSTSLLPPTATYVTKDVEMATMMLKIDHSRCATAEEYTVMIFRDLLRLTLDCSGRFGFVDSQVSIFYNVFADRGMNIARKERRC